MRHLTWQYSGSAGYARLPLIFLLAHKEGKSMVGASAKERELVSMRLFAPSWVTRRPGHSDELKKMAERGIPIKVLFNRVSHGVKISSTLVNQLLRKHPSLEHLSEDEEDNHFRSVTFLLKYGSFEKSIEFEAWMEKSEILGSNLPEGIDLEIGANIAREIVLHRRERAYLRPHAGGFRPVFRGRNFIIDPGLCFVLMPFGETWSDRVFYRHIKPTVEALGITCKRADDFFAPGVVIEDIWGAINETNIVIADLTGQNPNVFYELGLAHVVGVPTILLSQKQQAPAFDTVHWRQLFYDDNSEGCEILEKNLKAALIAFLADMKFP